MTYRDIVELRSAITKELQAEVSPMALTSADKLVIEARLQTALGVAVQSMTAEVIEVADEVLVDKKK